MKVTTSRGNDNSGETEEVQNIIFLETRELVSNLYIPAQVPPGSPIGSTCLVHRPGTNTVQLNNDQSFSFDFVEDAGDQEALFTSMVSYIRMRT